MCNELNGNLLDIASAIAPLGISNIHAESDYLLGFHESTGLTLSMDLMGGILKIDLEDCDNEISVFSLMVPSMTFLDYAVDALQGQLSIWMTDWVL